MSTKARKLAKAAIVASFLAVSATLLLPAFTGRPVVSYASSGSMEPTIGVLDVFFVNPFPDEIAIGDIIVYQSVTQGGPAVHRVVGGDEAGWITQGDANNAPDQNGGEPLVSSERILGKVVTRHGTPILLDDLSVPYLEASAQLTRAKLAVGGTRQLVALTFLALAVASGILGMASRPRHLPSSRMPRRARDALRRIFPRGILGRHVGLALLLLLLLTTAWGTAHARADVLLQMVVVQDATSADGVRAAARGGWLDHEIEVGSLGFLPTIVIVDPGSERVEVIEGVARAMPGTAAVLKVREHAADRSGLQEDVAQAWRYPAILPVGTILALHRIAPGAPYIAASAIVALVGACWFGALGVSRLPVGRLLGIREDWR